MGSREGCGHGAARPREPEEAHREELLEDEEVAREVKLKALLDAWLDCGEDQWKALVGFAAETRRRRWRLAVIGWRRKSR